jgi:hypothetical protein
MVDGVDQANEPALVGHELGVVCSDGLAEEGDMPHELMLVGHDVGRRQALIPMRRTPP